MKMRLPDFLVIGAMKAGTTSLWHDLRNNPGAFLPSVKEPNCLCRDEVLTPKGTREYASLFRRAKQDQICGEVSTAYTYLPTFAGVPERARRLLGPDLRLIYVVRCPIARAISHHYMLYRSGAAPADIDQAVRQLDVLIDYGRYAMQLDPWLQQFDRRNLLIVRFEDYVVTRVETVASICRFLRIELRPELIEADRVHHLGSEASVPVRGLRSVLNGIRRSRWYVFHVYPRLPRWVPMVLKGTLFRKPPGRPSAPSMETIDLIIDSVAEDARRLQKIMGRDEPVWDFETTRQRILAGQGGALREADEVSREHGSAAVADP